MRAMRLLGRPERESSWFSPWKRQSFAGHPWNLSAVNMERPSGIQQTVVLFGVDKQGGRGAVWGVLEG